MAPEQRRNTHTDVYRDCCFRALMIRRGVYQTTHTHTLNHNRLNTRIHQTLFRISIFFQLGNKPQLSCSSSNLQDAVNSHVYKVMKYFTGMWCVSVLCNTVANQNTTSPVSTSDHPALPSANPPVLCHVVSPVCSS